MEQLAIYLVLYFIGWVAGFATFGGLVWYTVNKGGPSPELVPVPVPVRNNPKDYN